MLSKEIQKFLDSLGMFGWRLGLERMYAIAQELRNPHFDFKSIHIAGSNGKGSVAKILETIFLEAGVSTGLYTSPHLISPMERIRINGTQVSQNVFERGLEEIKPLLIQHGATYFEALTALTFFLFSSAKIDIGIVETGLGGRLDATNIIAPECSVITSISLEHQAYLGTSIGRIAKEKAGIIKPEVPCVIGTLPDRAYKAVKTRCAHLNSPLIEAAERVSISVISESLSGTDFRFSINGNKDNARLGLAGSHQIENAKTAITACTTFAYKEQLLSRLPAALPRVNLPGRFQMVSEQPVIILDVAHNVESFQALFANLSKYFPDQTIHIIMGILRDKDIDSILKVFTGSRARLFCTTPQSERALDGRALHRAALGFGLASEYFPKLSKAIKKATQSAGADGITVITGSHYIAGEYLSIAK